MKWLNIFTQWRFYVWAWAVWVTVGMMTLLNHCDCQSWYLSIAQAAWR